VPAALGALLAVLAVLAAGRSAPPAVAPRAAAIALPPGTEDVPAADGAAWPVEDGPGWLRVALVQGSAPQEVLLAENPLDERARGFRQLALTGLALDLGADLVVWSESGHPGTVGRMPWVGLRLERLLAEAARRRGDAGPQALVGALVEVPAEPGAGFAYTNSILLLDGDGLVGRYDKRHLVPFGEYMPAERLFFWFHRLVPTLGDLHPGSSHDPVATRFGRAAVFVCYEAVLGHHVASLAAGDARLLVNVTNDGWFDGTPAPEQHLRFSALRAAETGRPLVRCANSGISAAFAADGRLVGRLGEGQRGLLLVSLPPATREALYPHLGDAPVVVAGVLAALAASLLALAAGGRVRGRAAAPDPGDGEPGSGASA